jgi:hypothetical protein
MKKLLVRGRIIIGAIVLCGIIGVSTPTQPQQQAPLIDLDASVVNEQNVASAISAH